MKFKVGDKVRIVDEWTIDCCQNENGEMDKWLGKIMTIRAIENGCYRMEEDRNEHVDGWYWRESCIAGYAFKYKVGQKLRVNLIRHSHFGGIIQITKAYYHNENIHYNYKYIEDTRPGTFNGGGFDENSLFGRNLIPVEDSKVVITIDGNETIARMFECGECVKTAVAKCNPSDEFNFETGAKLAFERLFPEEKPKFEKGKRYIFDRKTYEKNCSSKGIQWPSLCDGEIVTVKGERKGWINGFAINPEWCIEAPAFKAGDRVRIISKKHLDNFYDIGEVVTVRGITPHDNLNCINSKDYIQIVSPEDVEFVTFDWDKFKRGKLTVKLTKDNFDAFITEARKHGCKRYRDGDFNPFKCGESRFLFEMIHGCKLDDDEAYATYNTDESYLQFGYHNLFGREEFVW